MYTSAFMQLRIYAKYYHSMNNMILPDGFEARVVSVDERKHMFVDNHGTKIFFSYVLVVPLIALLTFVCYVGGTYDYIKELLEDSKYHPSQAALVCTGQTFNVFFVYMDIWALSTNELRGFMKGIIIALVCLEVFFFLIMFLYCFIIAILRCPCVDRAGGDGVKFWFVMASLIPPLFCLTSHIGFILVGWAAFTDHGTAIMLFYSFVVIYYFLLFQKIYSCFFLIQTKVKKQVTDPSFSFWMLLIEMTFGVIFLLVVIAYIFEGFKRLPVVHGADDVITHAFSFGQYVSLFAVFLLTYIIVYKGEARSEKRQNTTQQDNQLHQHGEGDLENPN